MLIVFGTLSAGLLLLAFAQIGAIIAYVRRLIGYVPLVVRDEDLPQALVVMSLRGGDESLAKCLQLLANQDYPRFRLQIVVDHPTDPASNIVDRWLTTKPNVAVELEYLRNPSPRSTLKCSAIRQVLCNLDSATQAIVFVDADTQPYPGWLRDLVSPLRLPEVGAVTGNRWYFPQRGSLGGWCRFIYNGLTLPPMDWFNLPWAGSLAIRREVALHETLLTKLECASSDESAVCKAVRDLQLQIHFNPRVILWNPEPTDLAGCSQFIFRQLLWTRLYHPAWTVIFAHALGSYLLLAAAFVWGIFNLWNSDFGAPAAALLIELGVYLAAVLFSLGYLHRAIRRNILPQQGNVKMGKITLEKWWQIVITAPLTLGVYTLSILWARFAKKVVWREIEYQIQPHGGLRLVEYRPISREPSPSRKELPWHLDIPQGT